jgi:hypothetical protein
LLEEGVDRGERLFLKLSARLLRTCCELDKRLPALRTGRQELVARDFAAKRPCDDAEFHHRAASLIDLDQALGKARLPRSARKRGRALLAFQLCGEALFS